MEQTEPQRVQNETSNSFQDLHRDTIFQRIKPREKMPTPIAKLQFASNMFEEFHFLRWTECCLLLFFSWKWNLFFQPSTAARPHTETERCISVCQKDRKGRERERERERNPRYGWVSPAFSVQFFRGRRGQLRRQNGARVKEEIPWQIRCYETTELRARSS